MGIRNSISWLFRITLNRLNHVINKHEIQNSRTTTVLYPAHFVLQVRPWAWSDDWCAVMSDTDADEWWTRRFSRSPSTSWPWERATCLPLGTTEEQMKHISEWGQLNKSKEGPISSKVWYPSRKWSQSSWSSWLCESVVGCLCWADKLQRTHNPCIYVKMFGKICMHGYIQVNSGVTVLMYLRYYA